MDSPINSRNTSDPGDVVLRKFRYQHAYGVILAIGMATGLLPLPCKALWCEQHEDFLTELLDGFFDAYQIKTRKAELGEWQLNDEAFWKSILRFVSLDSAYPGRIRSFKFVSNTHYSNSYAKTGEYLSPIKLLFGVQRVTRSEDLSGEVKKGFNCLNGNVSTTEGALFSVLRRLELVLGPTERAFEDELSQRHIPTLPECRSLNASCLRTVREALISRIAQASALVSDGPTRDWIGLTGQEKEDPFLLAKRITVHDLILTIRDALGSRVHFLPELASLELGDACRRLDALSKKMVRGGLAPRYEMMRRRTLTAEQVLLDLATRPDNGKALCSQVENVVLAECDDANLRASQTDQPFGQSMLIDVQDRLKRIAETDPERVCRQPYDLLVGVAGLLTSECKVWWSEQFELESER